MADSPAISVSGVSKKYRLYGSVKERLKEALHPFKKQYHREFWALRDISFEVPKGQTLGIIGRNGSGKSTLLEIICSILRPTSGAVEVDGRISALLELGAGFNPQFTGRDNVVFNAQLMGLSAQEIQDSLPKIEAFADIGEFIDQPVKTYSSGMFVRLAFAAAINVDPDILLVDEALAVGDIRFQQKCYRKFMDLQDQGKTIVLVTHDTNAISRHCDAALLLENGQLILNDEPRVVVNRYYAMMTAHNGTCASAGAPRGGSAPAGQPADNAQQPETPLDIFVKDSTAGDQCPRRRNYNPEEHRFGDGRTEIVDFLLLSNGVAYPDSVDSGDPISLYMKIRCHQDVPSFVTGFKLKTLDGLIVYATSSKYLGMTTRNAKKGETLVHGYHFTLPLAEGHYFFDVGSTELISEHKDAATDKRFDLIHLVVRNARNFRGVVRLDCRAEEIPVGDQPLHANEKS